MTCSNGTCVSDCPSGSTAGACGPIVNQKGQTLASSSPFKVICDFQDSVAQCVPAGSGCYKWDIIPCSECCIGGVCQNPGAPCP